jgi:hypothetical protein
MARKSLDVKVYGVAGGLKAEHGTLNVNHEE